MLLDSCKPLQRFFLPHPRPPGRSSTEQDAYHQADACLASALESHLYAQDAKILEDVKSYWSGRRLAFYKPAALNGVTDSVKDVGKG